MAWTITNACVAADLSAPARPRTRPSTGQPRAQLVHGIHKPDVPGTVGLADEGPQRRTGGGVPGDVADYDDPQPVVHELLQNLAGQTRCEGEEVVGQSLGRDDDELGARPPGPADDVGHVGPCGDRRAVGGQHQRGTAADVGDPVGHRSEAPVESAAVEATPVEATPVIAEATAVVAAAVVPSGVPTLVGARVRPTAGVQARVVPG